MLQVVPSILAGWLRDLAIGATARASAADHIEAGNCPETPQWQGESASVHFVAGRAMTDKTTEAAAKLEELSVDLKQAIIDIRENSGNSKWCYWRIYYLRRDLSRIVATLGAGIPPAYGRNL
jgi:hypothetical protein